jgi:collagenase-like PrtC family protease
VEATVTGRAKEVTLLYRVVAGGTEGKEVGLPMAKGADGRYAARIPGQAAGAIVRYRVKAVGEDAAVRYAPGENAGYPTLCKGRFEVEGETYYAIEEPTSLNTLELLPQIVAAGVAAIKIEGRQRSQTYVAQVTKVWRAAIDAAVRERQDFTVRPAWMAELNKVSEGQSHTLGAYNRPWK